MGFLSEESFQLLCGGEAVENENGGKESKRLCGGGQLRDESGFVRLGWWQQR